MDNNNKLFRIILIALLGLSAILSFLFMFDVVSEGILISWCYILLGIAAITAIVFPIIFMVQNPKNAKNALIGVGAVVAVCAIGYFLSGNEVHIDIDGKLLADAATSQKSEAGLIAFYILAAGAIGSIIFAEVSKMFK
jgi:hypothetical protein